MVDEKKQIIPLQTEMAKHNLNKMGIISKILVIVILIIACGTILKYKLQLLQTDHFEYYCTLLILLFSINAIASYAIDIKKVTVTAKSSEVVNKCVSLYVGVLIISSSLLSLTMHSIFVNQLIYTLAILLCSSLFVLRQKQLLIPLFISATILILGLLIMHADLLSIQLFFIYLAIILPVCFLVSRTTYVSYKRLVSFQLALMKDASAKVELTKQLNQTNRRLALQASHDALTQIPNRYAFNLYAEQLATRMVKERMLLTTIILDVDYFKNYNDFYGHAKGDATLKQIGQALQLVADKYGYFVSRWGGEEFTFILVNQEEERVNTLCENVLEVIQTLQIEHLASTVRETVTVSIGAYTQMIYHVEEIYDAIQYADEVLYNVKRNGRNNYEHRNAALITN